MLIVNALGGMDDPNHPHGNLVPDLSPRVLSRDPWVLRYDRLLEAGERRCCKVACTCSQTRLCRPQLISE